MTIGSLISGCGLPRLEAELLFGHAMGKTRTWIIAHENDECETGQADAFHAYVMRRKKNEPVAYITGKKEFFGRLYEVTADTLIPRPSTEVLAEETLAFLASGTQHVTEADNGIEILSLPLHQGNADTLLEVGTGSGCLAVTLALAKPALSVVSVDVSDKAIDVARRNAVTYACLNLSLFVQDGVRAVREMKTPFLLVSNPPYIPSGEKLEPNVRDYEPPSALFSGEQGTDLLLALAEAAGQNPFCTGMCLELRTDQTEVVKRAATSAMLRA